MTTRLWRKIGNPQLNSNNDQREAVSGQYHSRYLAPPKNIATW